MLEMKTEGGTIRLLQNDDGPIERRVIGEALPGECSHLISKAPVGLGDAVEEVAALAGVHKNTVLEALTSSQCGDSAEEIWPFRISYPCGLTERRPTLLAASLRVLTCPAELGPAQEVLDETTGEILPV